MGKKEVHNHLKMLIRCSFNFYYCSSTQITLSMSSSCMPIPLLEGFLCTIKATNSLPSVSGHYALVKPVLMLGYFVLKTIPESHIVVNNREWRFYHTMSQRALKVKDVLWKGVRIWTQTDGYPCPQIRAAHLQQHAEASSVGESQIASTHQQCQAIILAYH